MSDHRRLLLSLAVGALGTVVVVLLIALFLVGTDPGRAWVLERTLDRITKDVNGKVEIGRVEGNLFTRARVYGVAIYGPDGAPFVLADSGMVNYDLRTLIGGDVVLDEVALYEPEVFLTRAPGDTLWNYQVIFPDTTPSDTTPSAPTVIKRGWVQNGTIVMRTPWEPEEGEEVPDTTRLIVEREDGRWIRTMRFEIEEALVTRATFGSDEAGGNYVQVERLAGTAHIWQEPLHVSALEGELSIVDDRFEFVARRAVLPESRLEGYGVIGLGEDSTLDVNLAGDWVAFDDLRWLYPRLPREGGIEAVLTIERHPKGLLFAAPRLHVRAPETEIYGELALLFGDTLRFIEVDLKAPTLSVPTVEAMLPTKIPVQGLRIGSVEIGSSGS